MIIALHKSTFTIPYHTVPFTSLQCQDARSKSNKSNVNKKLVAVSKVMSIQ